MFDNIDDDVFDLLQVVAVSILLGGVLAISVISHGHTFLGWSVDQGAMWAAAATVVTAVGAPSAIYVVARRRYDPDEDEEVSSA